MNTLPQRAGGVTERDTTASDQPVANRHRLDPHDAADFVDRICTKHGTEAVGSYLDRGRSAVRQWVADPERIPLLQLAPLLELADPSDPFLRRFAASLGYRLLPLEPSAEAIVAALEEAGVIRRGSATTAQRVVRGLSRQGHLWEGDR